MSRATSDDALSGDVGVAPSGHHSSRGACSGSRRGRAGAEWIVGGKDSASRAHLRGSPISLVWRRGDGRDKELRRGVLAERVACLCRNRPLVA